MGIQALRRQPGTSQRHRQHKVYPYLLHKVAIGRANQVWALDTTYIPMARGLVYLTAVVDVASRKVPHEVLPRLQMPYSAKNSLKSSTWDRATATGAAPTASSRERLNCLMSFLA